MDESDLLESCDSNSMVLRKSSEVAVQMIALLPNAGYSAEER